jgi:osmoprotectant transport system ATP-binding protein
MIRLENVTKIFGAVKAVDDISFEVQPGEKLVLLGTSGCGKTTTLRMINRMIEPSQGIIYINGKNIKNQPPQILRRNIGYVLQHHGLFPHYTVAENIAIVPRLLKWDEQKIKDRTTLLLSKLHIDAQQFLHVYPALLSGGQQQRVGVARALAADPEILLMDEPFGALDPITRHSIKNELLQLDEFNKKTIIMVTHDVQEAFELGDRICLMDQGKIIQAGTPADLLFHPANHFVKEFLDAQRLLLEYKSIKLQDIIHQFPESQNSDQLVMSAQMNVWQAMEFLSGQNKNCIAIFDEKSGKIKQADIQLLAQSVNQLKTIAV